MNQASVLNCAIEYVVTYFIRSYFFFSAGYFWYNKFNIQILNMRNLLGIAPCRS